MRCADGAFVMGEMGQHTANAGQIYFPAGTPDRDDLRDGTVDIAGSVVREIEEETGLTPADYRPGGHWDCVVTGATIAMIRILNVDISVAKRCRRGSRPNLARQHQPELAAIHLVRGASDLTRSHAAFCHGVSRATVFVVSRHCEERKRRSNPALRSHGLLRGACHRARVRATRWLAMTTGLAPLVRAMYRRTCTVCASNRSSRPDEQKARAISQRPAKTLYRAVPLRRIGRVSSAIMQDQ